MTYDSNNYITLMLTNLAMARNIFVINCLLEKSLL